MLHTESSELVAWQEDLCYLSDLLLDYQHIYRKRNLHWGRAWRYASVPRQSDRRNPRPNAIRSWLCDW